MPNPYIALGADMVAYSGGKIIRGPQTAGLLIGRRDLVRAAWANSAPHHGFGRTAKVSKEEIVGMLRAVEVWREERDIQADMRLWESWYAEMIPQITKAHGVHAEVHGPIRGGPFPTLNISWDPKQIGLTAGDVGRALLNGEPRIMTQAEGEGHSFVIRPVAMKPGEHKIVARRLVRSLRGCAQTGATEALGHPRRRYLGDLGRRDALRSRIFASQAGIRREGKQPERTPPRVGLSRRSERPHRRRRSKVPQRAPRRWKYAVLHLHRTAFR